MPFSDVSICLVRHQTLHTAVIALGANLGDPQATLAAAVAELGEEVQILKVSPLAVTKPVGGPPDQPDYTNQVIEVRTQRSRMSCWICASASRPRTTAPARCAGRRARWIWT